MADSKFCRECGAALAVVPGEVRHEENAEMIADGKRLFAAARYTDAANVAVAVLDDDPLSVPALALHGDCLEALGDYDAALARFEQILSVRPESKLDEIRVTRLKQLIGSEAIAVDHAPKRKSQALGAAIAAAMLLISSGTALVLATRPTDDVQALDDGQEGVEVTPFRILPRVPTQTGTVGTQPLSDRQPNGEVAQPGNSITAQIGTELLGANNIYSPGILKQYDPNAPSIVDPRRLSPTGPYPVNPGTPVPTVRDDNNDTVDPPPDPIGSDDRQANSGRNSVIDIRPSEGQNSGPTTTSNGSESVDDTAALADTLTRVARQQYILANYEKAADAYEKALAAGASPGSTNQRLAQCYEKLGRRADAIRRYELAISAYERVTPLPQRAKLAIAACQQAIKILRDR